MVPAAPLAGALTGDRHQVLRLPDGRLFISFRDMGLASPRRGDWVAWVGTLEDLEAGRQGDLRVRLMENHRGTDCAYPALEWTGDGKILAVTYGHWTGGEQPWIAALRVDPDELSPPSESRARGRALRREVGPGSGKGRARSRSSEGVTRPVDAGRASRGA